MTNRRDCHYAADVADAADRQAEAERARREVEAMNQADRRRLEERRNERRPRR